MSGAHVDISSEGYLGRLCAWGKKNKNVFLNVLDSVFAQNDKDRVARLLNSNFMVEKHIALAEDNTAMPNFQKYGVVTPFCAEDNIFTWYVPRYSSAELLTDDTAISTRRQKAMQLAWNRFLNSSLNILFLKYFAEHFKALAKSISAHSKILKRLESLKTLRENVLVASALYNFAMTFVNDE
jgi:hypothetical protein